MRSCARAADRSWRRTRRRSRRSARAAALGVDTTPWRWFHTCRVTHTSSTPQVATMVLTTLLSTIGKASQEPARVHRNAVTAWTSVTAMSSTARTAAVRTGSGILRRLAGSSTHSGARRAYASRSLSSSSYPDSSYASSSSPDSAYADSRPPPSRPG